ncbi:MAG TPA: S8 family serine peptidase, partial [Candidatus Acidoferrum sp.]|nr:S8 family serine peptidase [Candidatus Acidoferrum sp.]
PDVVGLVGMQPRAVLISLPTQPRSDLDVSYGSDAIDQPFPDTDNTTVDDGWSVLSGTSAAAPQAAGVAALLLGRYPSLTPMAVKNVLENSAVDVTSGSSATGDTAGPGWDAATGSGLICGQAAIDYLTPGTFDAYIRRGTGQGAALSGASPDIIVRTSAVRRPQVVLGLTVKHRCDLCDPAHDGQDNYIYLRVQNRGALPGRATATVYFAGTPRSWTKLSSIGQLDIRNLRPGEFRVVGPLVWRADIPGPGHSLIAILDSADDRAPNLTRVQNARDFMHRVYRSNNVAWREV